MQSLSNQIVAFRDARAGSQRIGLENDAVSLLVEAGPLAEHSRWHDDATLGVQITADTVPLADELADVLYWALEIAQGIGIDLSGELERRLLRVERKVPVKSSCGRARRTLGRSVGYGTVRSSDEPRKPAPCDSETAAD